MNEIDENRIPLNVNSLKQLPFQMKVEFALTEKEKRVIPNLVSLGDGIIYLDITGTVDDIIVNISFDDDITLIDAHLLTEVKYHLEDDVDVYISKREEDSDILPDKDGIYDLRGSILALLYNGIPNNYSTTALDRIDTDSYILMSEEEYERTREKNNPFASLDDEK